MWLKPELTLHNAFGFHCPDCTNVGLCEKPTAFVHRVWDEQYKVYKKYVRCNDCFRTTPAYSNVEDAVDNWKYQWALKEDKILMGDKEK